MAFVSNDEINNIRAKANIVDIVASYLSLEQKGKNYICQCPFHDDHSPSMSVSAEKQIYKCFSCGETGNVFSFVEKYENVSFIEAVKIVAEKSGVEFTGTSYTSQKNDVNKLEYEIMEITQKYFVNNLKTTYGHQAIEYLSNRGINEDAIKEFGIGLSLDESDSLLKLLSKKKYDLKKLTDLGLINQNNNKNYDMFTRRITFPLSDKDGNIVGFSARIYRNEQNVSKYMNSKENVIFKKGETLYNYSNAKNIAKRQRQIIVVEGFMDAIRLSINGIKNVVALCGTAMTNDHVNLLKKLRSKVILCLDNDEAGLKNTLSNGEILVKNNIDTYVIRISGQKDPDEYILANGIEAFQNNLDKPLTFFEFKMNYLKKDKNLDNVEDLSSYINSVLDNLKLESDDILVEVTLNKLSEEYKISLEVLKNKLKELIGNEEKIKINLNPVIVNNNKKSINEINIEKILYFMMNGVEYTQEYQKKLSFIDNATYRQIANEIIFYVQTNKEINVADFITYVSQKDEIKDTVMNIVSESLNDEVSVEVMDDYLEAIRKSTIKEEIKKIKTQMKKELDIDKKMDMARKLADLKKEVF